MSSPILFIIGAGPNVSDPSACPYQATYVNEALSHPVHCPWSTSQLGLYKVYARTTYPSIMPESDPTTTYLSPLLHQSKRKVPCLLSLTPTI